MKFEVGKKYKERWNKHPIIWTCLWVSPGGHAYATNESGHDSILYQVCNWEECKEPKVHKRYVVWFRYLGENIGCALLYGSDPFPKKWTVVKTEEVTYTET